MLSVTFQKIVIWIDIASTIRLFDVSAENLCHKMFVCKQIAKLSQYEEKINSLQEEKISLEKQLALSHSTMTQLQQQNSSLVAELGEPQRKLLQLHEAGFLTLIVQEYVTLNLLVLCRWQ